MIVYTLRRQRQKERDSTMRWHNYRMHIPNRNGLPVGSYWTWQPTERKRGRERLRSHERTHTLDFCRCSTRHDRYDDSMTVYMLWWVRSLIALYGTCNFLGVSVYILSVINIISYDFCDTRTHSTIRLSGEWNGTFIFEMYYWFSCVCMTGP